MKISTKVRYALRMLLDLCIHHGDGYIALNDIACGRTSQKNILGRSYRYSINPTFCVPTEVFKADTDLLNPR